MPKRITYSKEPWTQTEQDKVVQLLSEKKSVQEISQVVNRSPNAIIYRFLNYAERKQFTPEQASEYSGIPVETIVSHIKQQAQQLDKKERREDKREEKRDVKQEVKREEKREEKRESKREEKRDKSKYNTREYKDEHLQLTREIRDYLKIIANAQQVQIELSKDIREYLKVLSSSHR